MNHPLDSLLAQYDPISQEDYENALKEIVQHLALLALWMSKFYEHAAFYGGTALRIFYGSKRSAICSEFEAFGFGFTVEEDGVHTRIKWTIDRIKARL